MEQELSADKGVERALQIMNAIPVPPHKRDPGEMHDIERDEDRARLVTSDFRLIVKCLPRGNDKTLTIVIVAGNNGEQARQIMETVRDVMHSGFVAGLFE